SGGSAMRPLAPGNTAWEGQPGRCVPAAPAARFLAVPAGAVKAFEFPALTTRARALPPPDFSASRHQSTSADRVAEVVKTPPADAPSGKCTTSRSSRRLPL